MTELQQRDAKVIRWPWNWTPRPQHVEVFKAIERGIRRVLLVVHRRWGKSSVGWNLVIKRALEMPGTLHIYCGPTWGQVSQILWTGRDHRGKRFLDYIPRELIARVLENEREIHLVNGSVIRLMSAENPDRLRGLNAVTVVFDEWSVYPDGACWDVVQPMLVENGGLAAFLYTPMGENHGLALYLAAQQSPEEWFVRKWDITQTRRDGVGEDGQPIISEAEREQMRRDGTPDSALRRDLDCSFEAPTEGAVFGVEMERLLVEGRITSVPWQAHRAVESVWDLGARGNNAVLLIQRFPSGRMNILEALRSGEEGLPALVREVLRRPYTYAMHHVPHDAEQRERGSNVTLRAQLAQQGLRPTSVVKNVGIEAGIYAAKSLLSQVWADGEKAAAWVTSMRQYRQDDKGQPVKDGLHDHMADCFRYAAVAALGTLTREERREAYRKKYGSGGPPVVGLDFDPFDHGRGNRPSDWSMPGR